MMSEMDDFHRYPRPITSEAIAALSARFDLPVGPDDQDWEYTCAEASRLPGFLKALECDDLTDPERFTLSEIVMQCFEDLLSAGDPTAKPPDWDRFATLLIARPELHAFTLRYWSVPDSTSEDAFYVSFLVRPLWGEVQSRLRRPEEKG
jgi:hypothetical protein